MSLDAIKAVKTDKGYRKGDIVVYSLILLIFLTVLFAVIFGIRDDELSGFEVYYGNEKVFSYSFSTESGNVYSELMTVISDDSAGITIRFENKGEFNEIYADKMGRSVRVLNANCSLGKDCVNTGALDGSGKIIVCVPHKLKILPVGGKIGEIVTG